MTSEIDIRELRKRKRWNQERMADYLGVDRSTVSRLENGQEMQGPVRRLLAMLAAEVSAASEAAE